MNDASETPAAEQLRLARDLRALVDDAEALLRHAVQDAGQGYAAARARLEESLARAKARLDATERAVRGQVRQKGAAVNDYVHQNPWPAIGAGAAAGALVALLLARR